MLCEIPATAKEIMMLEQLIFYPGLMKIMKQWLGG
jgi:hypothetical protein